MSERNQTIEIHRRIVDALSAGVPVWLLTVVSSDGSTPAKPGMRQLVYLDGAQYGTVGGGAVERMAIERVRNEKPDNVVKWSFDLGKKTEFTEATGMICGGMLELLVEPICAGVPLYIFGGGHCGVELSALAPSVGFRVTVVDNRPEWANRERHPSAFQTIVCEYSSLSQVAIEPNSFVVVMTHGHSHDETVLRQLLPLPLQYIGVIGSESKVRTMFHRLLDNGIPRSELQKVFAPVGLPIGSHTPQEIAISILAQLLAVKNKVEKIEINANPLLMPDTKP